MTTSDPSAASDSPAPYFGVFDLFKIGIGPSSSHSVGPMCAAHLFLVELLAGGLVEKINRIRVDLYGSLALTGLGHGTDTAVLMGLSGEQPETIDPDSVADKVAAIRESGAVVLPSGQAVAFHENRDLVFNRRITLDAHPNGIRFQAFASADAETPLLEATYFSVGGGFVVREGERPGAAPQAAVPFPFSSAKELLALAAQHGLCISGLMRENERALRSDAEVSDGLQRIWDVMQECVARGCRTRGTLPGGLGIARRAPGLLDSLAGRDAHEADPMAALDWVNLFALAVSEENA
ncbi:MAG: L-serine ammonia-lyase, iron-sulfur-dependent, subunit alpha, partial [Planctomycetales bacterium]|nr:L-serine ammonia-lyase, iron-sulfur-dependent, subunit alpha [Planctomycetales bacterium]